MNLSNDQLVKRMKSLLWRVGMMTAAFIFATLSENIGILELSSGNTVFLGLVLGEISKAINTRAQV